jgi:hypothetical protein
MIEKQGITLTFGAFSTLSVIRRLHQYRSPIKIMVIEPFS